MKVDILWRLPLIWTWLGAFAVVLAILGALIGLNTDYVFLLKLFIVLLGILWGAFTVRLPSGAIWKRVLFEAFSFAVAVALFFAGITIVLSYEPALDYQGIFEIFGILSLFSYVSVRVFARLYVMWRVMRDRRLVWQITHAQLRLVLLTMIVLFFMTMLLFMGQMTASGDETLYVGLTLFITISGFFGIMTGILLLVVIIPAAVISYVTASRLTKRIERLADLTHTIRNTGNYAARIPVEGIDEIAQLQRDFNQMLAHIEASQAAIATERDRVRKLLQTRQKLFADVSHELRTPIAVLRSYMEGMRVDAAQQGDLEIVQREIIRLQHLVDNVFAFAREDVNQLPYDIRPVEVGAILERITAAIHKQGWQSHKVSVMLTYEPQLPLVLADGERIEQILYNLLRNALKHTQPGGIIRIQPVICEDHIKIEVQDTGTGIAEEDMTRIWERFYRGGDAQERDQKGAGLGLALVKEMVESMGGTVDVTSELGKGSCFSFTLPRVKTATDLRQV